MTETLQCEEVVSRGYVERYLARKLPEEEVEAFESHFLTCDRCQESLRLGAGIRTALRAPRRARARPAWVTWGGGLGLAAAAGLAAILLFKPDSRAGPLARLGELIQAPVYLGIPVRAGEAARADSLFELAMGSYGAERYPEAAAGLRRALDAGVDPAPAEFFLGASQLMTGKPADAAASFARVIARGETPYLAEAHFYRAKALLRMGNREGALADLRQASERSTGVIGNYARALTDSIERLVPR